jgi:hypothetical protein
MDKTLLIKSIFLFISLWGFTIGFLWFRPRLEIFWKIIATLIFLFYLWFFWQEINRGYAAFTLNWYNVTVDFIKELVSLVFVNLFFLWPLALVIIFYKADDMGAERLLKFMCILSLVLWVVFVIYVYFDKGIDKFLYQNLKEMIPDAKK